VLGVCPDVQPWWSALGLRGGGKGWSSLWHRYPALTRPLEGGWPTAGKSSGRVVVSACHAATTQPTDPGIRDSVDPGSPSVQRRRTRSTPRARQHGLVTHHRRHWPSRIVKRPRHGEVSARRGSGYRANRGVVGMVDDGGQRRRQGKQEYARSAAGPDEGRTHRLSPAVCAQPWPAQRRPGSRRVGVRSTVHIVADDLDQAVEDITYD
jgi:hypothetical protein